MNQTKKELSYFRLKLEGYLRDHHPELMADSAFIGARADLALSTYCDSVAQGFSRSSGGNGQRDPLSGTPLLQV